MKQSVDPYTLMLPDERSEGPDAEKLKEQFLKHGVSFEGMSPILVSRVSAGRLVIMDGVTRAARWILCCGRLPIPVEVVVDEPWRSSELHDFLYRKVDRRRS